MPTITGCLKRMVGGRAAWATTSSDEDVVYLVTVTESGVSNYELLAATFTPDESDTVNEPMPQFGDVHGINPQMRVINKSAERARSNDGQLLMHVFVVTVSYGFPQGQSASGGTDLSSNITVSVSGVRETIYTQKTLDSGNTPLRNAAGDLYPDPQPVTLYDEKISIRFRTTSLDMDAIAQSRGCVNSGTVTLSIAQGSVTFSRTFARDTLLLDTCDYSVVVSETNPEAHEFDVDLVLLYRYNDGDGWLRKLPQKGFRYFAVPTGGGTAVLTAWKEHAEYLDADGKKLADGAALVLTDPEQFNTEADLATLLAGV